ncbi:MAG: glycerate kinase [Bacteroidota bacterium]
MKILIAPDSFKDSLAAPAVAHHIGIGLQAASASIRTQEFPLADGGEGTIAILHQHIGGEWVEVEVKDPLGRSVKGRYSLQKERKTAFIEMAEASGIQLLRKDERQGMQTSTFGTGQLIRHAIEQGANHLYLGIGSSATCDGGTGMAEALGFTFWQKDQPLVGLCGEKLGQITRIDASTALPSLAEISCTVICDVDNPLTGPQGSAVVYGPQKGVSESDLPRLDQGLQNLNQVLTQTFGQSFGHRPGAGAAGGMGAGTMAFLGATLEPGVELVMQLVDFEAQLATCDLVITGEGSIDDQTLNGKLIKGITNRASAQQIPVIGIGGRVLLTIEQQRALHLKAAFSLVNGPMSLEQALINTPQNLERLGFQIGSLVTGASASRQ